VSRDHSILDVGCGNGMTLVSLVSILRCIYSTHRIVLWDSVSIVLRVLVHMVIKNSSNEMHGQYDSVEVAMSNIFK
jgi:ubiquinone/menaquinone biosynthesis C-methylase UbiE